MGIRREWYEGIGEVSFLIPAIDASYLQHQREWSEKTFGPGMRTQGLISHITKELKEIEAAPHDLSEWADIIILGLDGAWRAGWDPQEIIDGIIEKQHKNELRNWPDWRTTNPDEAIEHVRE